MMARELVLDVIARKNSRELNALADDFDKAARKAEATGKSFDKTASFSKHLDTEIAKTKTTIKELGAEFDRTGNKDVFAKLRGAQGNLRGLENIRKQLASAIDKGADDGRKSLLNRLVAQGKSMGSEFGGLFGEGLGGALRSPAGIGLAVTGAAALGNAMFGALLTGVGLGGIATGIVGQLKDPRVKAAGGQLGKDVSAGFKDATSSFATPLVTSLYIFDKEWNKLQPGLKKTFADLAPEVVQLSKGAAGFVDEFVPALERAAVAGRPLVQDLALYLPRLGRELGGFFDTLGRNAGGLQAGLHGIEDAVDGVVKVSTTLIPITSRVGQAFEYAHLTLGPAGQAFHAVGEALDYVRGRSGDVLAKSLRDASGATDELASSFGQGALTAQQLADKVKDLEQRLENEFQTTMNLSQATGDWTHGLANLKAQLDLHDITLNETTDAGHKNADALRRMASEAERVREASIAAAGGQNASAAAVDDANRKYVQQIGQLESMAVQLGLSRSAVHGLIDQWLNLIRLPNVTKKFLLFSSSVGEGVAAGYAQATRGHRYGGVQHFALGGMFAAGSAGVVRGGGPYAMFGEPGTGASTEGFLPRSGISRMRAGGLLSEMGAWYGYGVTSGDRSGGNVIKIDITVKDDSGKMLQVINREVQARGGNVQVALGGYGARG